MLELTLIAVGFLAATAVVIALARGTTARWERDKRAAAAVRADAPARRTSPAGSSRIPGELTRRGVEALRSRASRLSPVVIRARLLPKGGEQGTSRVRPIRRLGGVRRSSLFGGKLPGGRWTTGRSPAPPVDDVRADPALPPTAPPTATGARRNGVAGASGRKLLRRTLPRPGQPRHALAFLHRHADPQDARVPHEEGDESPTAR